MDFFVLYDTRTAEELGRLSGPDGSARLQPLGEYKGVVMIPQQAYADSIPLLSIPSEELLPNLLDFRKTIRDDMLLRGAMTEWGAVDSDPRSLINLQMKASAARLNETDLQSFTMRDDSVIQLSSTDMVSLVRQAMAYLDGIHCHARELKTQLKAAEHAEDLLKIDIFRGWPALPKE